MLTPEQILEDVETLLKHLRKKEYSQIIEKKEESIFYKPQPFQFAKLEYWKPSKHVKNRKSK